VYVNMLTANMYANADDALAYEHKPVRPDGDAELFGPSAGYRLYRADGDWLFLAVGSDDEWRRCWGVIERPDLVDDPRYSTAAARAAADAELVETLADALGKLPAGEWQRRFLAAGVAGVCADAATPGQFFAHDPQSLANEFAPECTHVRFGPHRRWGPVVRVNGGLDMYGPGALAGEHTDALLAEVGRSAGEIAELRAHHVVASEPVAWM
jgi:crotonobetainyl-CoA:carnitine CoA-transferase CaiB-like acyl-CoA transferase